MSGHLQQHHERAGFRQAISVPVTGLNPLVTLAGPLWFNVYAIDGVHNGDNYDVGIVGYSDGVSGTQVYYGRDVVHTFPHTFSLFGDTLTNPLSTFPPQLADDLEGLPTDPSLEITLNGLTIGNPALYYLEWWDNMLWTFAQRVKDELEATSWTSAPSDYLLVADSDPARLNAKIKVKLKDRLIVLHSLEEVEAGAGFDGGIGRNGRQLGVLISCYVKSRAPLDAQDEETPLATIDALVEDIHECLNPTVGGHTTINTLTGYVYFGKLETVGAWQDAPEIGSGVYVGTLKYTGYKMEV